MMTPKAWWQERLLAVTLPMAQTSQVEGRLRAVLGARRRGEATRLAVVACACVVLTTIVALAAVRLMPQSFVSTFMWNGVRVHAQVWQEVAPGGRAVSVFPEITVTGTPNPSQHWELDVTATRLTWGLFHHADLGFGSIVPLHHVGTTQTGLSSLDMATPSHHVTPYPVHGCTVHIDAQLCRYDFHDERVTFHNLHFVQTPTGLWILSTPRPISRTTPSGVTLTLVTQPTPENAGDLVSVQDSQSTFQGWYRSGLHCWLRLSPASAYTQRLPLSPLYRAYHQPVIVRLVTPQDVVPLISGQQPTRPWYGASFNLPPPGHRPLKNLTFIVRQRVDLQKVPMSFTVPLETRPWPVFPQTVKVRSAQPKRLK